MWMFRVNVLEVEMGVNKDRVVCMWVCDMYVKFV